MITTIIEIAAPPERVRKILLDFPSIPSWDSGFIKSLQSDAQSSYAPGDKLTGHMGGVDFTAFVVESNPNVFSWTGPKSGPAIYGLYRGIHSFRFEPSETTPGGTTFRREETFEGMLAFIWVPWGPLAYLVRTYFDGFNRDLKARCEREG